VALLFTKRRKQSNTKLRVAAKSPSVTTSMPSISAAIHSPLFVCQASRKRRCRCGDIYWNTPPALAPWKQWRTRRAFRLLKNTGSAMSLVF